MGLSDAEARARVAAIEDVLARVERLPEEARALAGNALRLVLELHGEALRRLLARGGADLAGFAAGDELVSHLLLLHDLHPDATRERVERALAAVRPTLAAHGGDVALVALEGSPAAYVARVRLTGSCDGCPSSALTLRLAVEQAIREHAPEVGHVEAEGLAPADGVAAAMASDSAARAPAQGGARA